MKKLFLLIPVILLISLIIGCSKLGNPSVDDTSPTVSSVAPSNGATGIASGANVTVTFSESMNESVTQEAFTISPAVSGDFSWSGNTMTFAPDILAYNTEYTCTVSTDAKDPAGNYLASTYTWSFKTAYSGDTTAPTISSVTPSNGAANIATIPTIVAAFNEEMNESSAQEAFTISPSVSGDFSWNGNTMTFTPGSELSTDTTYTCSVGTGAQDLTGNSLASAKTWSFTTESTNVTAPTVILVNPSDYATEIAVSSAVLLTFSEGMNESSVQSAFSISPSVSGNVDWTGNTMTFTPNSELSTDTTYTCTVGTGATDLAGNPMAAEYTSSFTTVLTVAPTVVSVSPSEGAADVPVTTSVLSATFSQPMDTSSFTASTNPTLKGTTSWDALSKTVTLTIDGNLASSTTYTCAVRAENVAGTNMESVKQWSFTTAP